MSGLRFARALFSALALALVLVPRVAFADDIAAYDTFVKGATSQPGLFTLWHKAGKLYIELSAGQLDHDFVQTIVPSSGLGGNFVVWGNTDHLPTELVRFERAGTNVAILWPNPYFIAPSSPAAQRAIDRSFARSVVGLAPIAAEKSDGTLVIDASPFLDDQLNLKSVIAQGLAGAKGEPYSLDKDRTYFGSTKAFPKNIVIEAMQDWTSADLRVDDATPDPRHVQMRVTYNIADPPSSPDYRPRLADDRVGIYDDIYLSFDKDTVLSRKLRYIVRWNMQASDPSQPVSPAKHPMVFYLSNTIPERWRPAIRNAVLKWNDAFLRIGISNAIQVLDQPSDSSWDPDDIRYNVLRWVTEYSASFGADSQTLYDPRTGEEFRTGILISADVPIGAQAAWTHIIDPVRFGRSTDPMPAQFMTDNWTSVILHETGHNMGMQHNFIGSLAYSARQLQSKAFTSRYGIASTVMEYAPTNVWPRGTPQGDYVQTTLGPYDYYAIHWAYAPIPGARTPEQEEPTLQRWASAWSDPRYRYASDEDVSWGDGHAADPRVEQGDLTNDPLGWCRVQLDMMSGLLRQLNQRFPARGAAYEDERDAAGDVFGGYDFCASMPAHYIGGQYLSRAHRGDPGAQTPIVPVPRTVQRRAFDMLNHYVFSAVPLNVPATVLNHLIYSEWAGYGYVGYTGYGNLPKWAYDPPKRHDFRFEELVAQMQDRAIRYMFAPTTLARLAGSPMQSSERRPMTLADLFAWMHGAVYREIGGRAPRSIAFERRTLQKHYLDTLVGLFVRPKPGAPDDARSLARSELVAVETQATRAAKAPSLDGVTRAHVEWLAARARGALIAGDRDVPAAESPSQ
ncbi:MAG: zinc-dependent metalloprotease [Candidatus Eremiobacteraeota bacterium]|nr:zinc-dependent metalloprotease [Candidatus Eremiobacteraeota bacterium]